MKVIFEFILKLLKNIWLFFERYGITIIAIATAIICIFTIIFDLIIFFKKLHEDQNLSFARLKEEIMHELMINDKFEGSSEDKIDENDDIEDDDLVI